MDSFIFLFTTPIHNKVPISKDPKIQTFQKLSKSTIWAICRFHHVQCQCPCVSYQCSLKGWRIDLCKMDYYCLHSIVILYHNDCHLFTNIQSQRYEGIVMNDCHKTISSYLWCPIRPTRIARIENWVHESKHESFIFISKWSLIPCYSVGHVIPDIDVIYNKIKRKVFLSFL